MDKSGSYDISFVIPAHNGAKELVQTVNSVLKQKEVETQLIIIDGSSQPPLKQILKRKSWASKIFRLKIDHGPAFARNQGLDKVKAPFVCFLDADDVLEPEFSKQMIDAIQNNKSASLCLSKTIFDRKMNFVNKFIFSLINLCRNLVLRFLYIFNNKTLSNNAFFAVSTSRIVMPSSLAKKLKFNEKIKQCEDWELAIRILKKGEIFITPQKLLSFRFSVSSQTRRTRKNYGFEKYRRVIKMLEKKDQDSMLIFAFKIYIKVMEIYYAKF